MKKYIVKLTLGLMLSAAFITACTDDDDDDQAIAFGLSTEELVFPENGGTESVTITTANTWNINANASWLKITPANGMEAESSPFQQMHRYWQNREQHPSV